MTELTQARLFELFSYDANTGIFTRLKSTSSRARVGDTVKCKTGYGYLHVRIDRVKYLCHRLAWLYVHGTWPKDQIDHINGIRDDNRLCNLREATRFENQQNRSASINNTSGYVGVSWHKQSRKWRARIQHCGKRTNLGYFDTLEEAHAAYLRAKQELHTFNPTIRG